MTEYLKKDSIGLTENVLSTPNEYGELIFPKFYKLNKGISIKMKKIFRLLIFIFGLLIAMTSSALIWALKYNSLIAYITLGVGFIGTTLLLIRFIYSYYRLIDKDHKNINRHAKNGGFDWDIYDAGLLIKYYSKKPIVRIDQEFVPFKTLSKVYLNHSLSQVEEILSLILRDYGNEIYPLDDNWQNIIQNRIYFLGIDGKLTDFYIEKEDLVDKKRFEIIIRQKIKEVI